MTSSVASRRIVALVLGAVTFVGAGGAGVAPASAGTARPARATAIANPSAECSAGSSCVIRWDAVGRAVKVYAGTAVGAIDRSRPVAQAPVGQSSVTVSGLDPLKRWYFALAGGSNGSGTVVADRSLHLQSAPNARDLGGYRTTDGRTVKWGTVFRSDSLSKSTDEDLQRIAALGIKVVCDFRGPSEVEADGVDKLPPGSTTEVVSLPVFDASNDLAAKLRTAIVSGDRSLQEPLLGGGRAQQILVDGGGFFVTDPTARRQFRAMLERLADPASLPAVLHCTAGKDRTGWASALVLTILGVPRETVFTDYLATNQYTQDTTEGRIRSVQSLLYDPELLRPLLEVRREYLQASFDAVQSEYGSFSRYLKKGLGVSDATVARLRKNLLGRGEVQ